MSNLRPRHVCEVAVLCTKSSQDQFHTTSRSFVSARRNRRPCRSGARDLVMSNRCTGCAVPYAIYRLMILHESTLLVAPDAMLSDLAGAICFGKSYRYNSSVRLQKACLMRVFQLLSKKASLILNGPRNVQVMPSSSGPQVALLGCLSTVLCLTLFDDWTIGWACARAVNPE